MNSTAGSAGSSGSIMVGVRSSYGTSRVLMRFPSLSLEGISASDITTATIGLRDLMCQGNQNFVVECRVYDKSAPAWSESSPPTFTAANSYIGSTVLHSYTVTYNGGTGGGNWYHFNILEAAKAWANGTQDPAKGLIFKASDSFESQTTNLWYKTFGSYNRSSHKPSLKIVYNAEPLPPPQLSFGVYSINMLIEEMAYTLINTNAVSVEWESIDPSVATVDSYGMITAVALGETVITATGTFSDGSTATAECEVAVIPFPEGTYFLRNKQTKHFADIKGPTMAAGTTIHQWEFHGGTSQKWIFDHRGDGYYAIKSANSTSVDYYLGVQGDLDATETPIILRSGTITDGMLWRVTTTTSGAYRLTPKTGNWCLCTWYATSQNGGKLFQGWYAENDSYKDEWELSNTIFSYVNYYDSSFANNQNLIHFISQANTFANSAYSKWYGIKFRMDGEATRKYDALADQCSHGVNSPCTNACGSSCNDTHHKNLLRASDQLFNAPREDNHIYVMWSHRSANTYCDGGEDNIHTLSNGIGVVYYHRPVIHFVNISGDDYLKKEMCMGIALAHETAHTFGMDDVYDNVGHDVDDETVCIMERFDQNHVYDFYQGVSSGYINPFCNSCEAQIRNYTSNLFIFGN